MTRLTKQKRCPTCGGIDFTRRHRVFWMRWFTRSQFFVCRHCRTKVLLLGARDGKGRDAADQCADG